MYLYTLGRLEFSGTRLSRPKPLLLLTYLCLEGPKQRRHLAELFYPDNVDPMLSLRVALGHLRSACQDKLTVEERKVDAKVSTDALSLLSAYEQGAYAQVIANYGGCFLDGLYIKDYHFELEEWVLGTREYLADLVREAHLHLSESLARDGDFVRAARHAESAYGLSEASSPEPRQLELILSLMESGKSGLTPRLKKEMTELGLSLRPQTFLPETLVHQEGAKTPSTANNLSIRANAFIGRQDALDDLQQFLSENQNRLLTITGLGGIGKTRLSLEFAQRQLQAAVWEGIYFISLDALTESVRVLEQIASTLSLNLPDQTEALSYLCTFIGNQKLLLILDNFEHLLPAADKLAQLISHCPRLFLLVTSRERLNLELESVYPLAGLELAILGTQTVDEKLDYETRDDESKRLDETRLTPAVQLFIDRARNANLHFLPDVVSLKCIAELCRLLEGAPLGIELAAAWIKVMPVAEILEDLRKNLDSFSDRRSSTPERHKSLRAAFEHSWKLLTETEQSAFKSLAVFNGGFRRDAGAVICNVTIPVLASLVDKSLLKVSSSGRFDRHTLLYQFSHEKLEQSPELKGQCQAKHAYYFLDLAETAAAELRSEKQLSWLERLAEEGENIKLALDWTLKEQDSSLSLRLLSALGLYWYLGSQFGEGLSCFEQVFNQSWDFEQGLQASALYHAGRLARSSGEFDKAQRWLEQSLHHFEQLNQIHDRLKCLNELGILAAARSQYQQAKALFEQNLSLALDNQDGEHLYLAHTNLGLLQTIEGNFDEAKMHLQQGLVLIKDQDEHGKAHLLSNLGLVALRQGQLQEAFAHFQEGYYLAQHHDLKDVMAEVLLGMGAAKHSEAASARAYFKRSLVLYSELRKTPGILDVLSETAKLALATGSSEFALQLWGACLHLRKRFNYPVKPFEEEVFAQQMSYLGQSLADAKCQAWMVQGELWSFDEALSKALAWLELS